MLLSACWKCTAVTERTAFRAIPEDQRSPITWVKEVYPDGSFATFTPTHHLAFHEGKLLQWWSIHNYSATTKKHTNTGRWQTVQTMKVDNAKPDAS